MPIKLLSFETTDETTRLEIDDVDYSLVNSLRHSIENLVKGIAMTDVTINENIGPFPDEFIQDRIMLCPLHIPIDFAYNYDQRRRPVTVTLKVTNDSNTNLHVTSKDFVVEGDEGNVSFPSHPVSKDYPLITILRPGEKLDVSARVTKGNGHAWYCPVSGCFHRFVSLNPNEKDYLKRFGECHERRLEVFFDVENGYDPRELVSKAIDELSSELTVIKETEIVSNGDDTFSITPTVDTCVGYMAQAFMEPLFDYVGVAKRHIYKENIEILVRGDMKNVAVAIDNAIAVLEELKSQL